MGAKPKVKIIGGSFLGHSKSMSLREDNANVSPTYFEWVDSNDWNSKTVFFCDGGVRETFPLAFIKNIAILTEPPSLHPENYEYVKEHHDKFHAVLTYSKELLDTIPNGMFYPLGGSSIAFDDWGLYPKTKDVCMIVSEKDTMPGHKLRHKIVKMFLEKTEFFQGHIDFYGAGVGNPFDRKFDVLKDYKYCIVVESEKTDHYFSEKLLDPISVGCHPIYWGSQFNFAASQFHLDFLLDINYLDSKLRQVQITNNCFREDYTYENITSAKKFSIAEDFIWNTYPELFT